MLTKESRKKFFDSGPATNRWGGGSLRKKYLFLKLEKKIRKKNEAGALKNTFFAASLIPSTN